ncbi:MAG: ABC transporter permease subunit [Verrucomicrobia bacterium]|nr:ABC transporter permease subunit [Verrucomicrobiota bacterium]
MMMFWLHLRNELWKLFGKKRTYIGFGVFLLAQNLMLLAFRFSNWQKGTAKLLESNGYIGAEFISALTVALLMLLPQILLLMPLYVMLVGGDIVAKEAEDGALRMILSRPISRFRLLFTKWLTGVIFATILVVSLGAMALLFARCWFGWKGMFVFIPIPGGSTIFNVMGAGEGLQYYALAHVFLAVNACTMLSLAFMFSCFNMKPAAATILAMSVLFLSVVMEGMPFFEDWKEFAITHHFRAWVLVFGKPMQTAQIAQSLFVLLAVNVTAFVIGATHFHLRDIKS